MTTKFCTVDQVKAYLNAVDSYSGDDTAITQHIKTATSLIKRYTRRSWVEATFVEHFSTQQINVALGTGVGVARFTLKERPIQSITAILYSPSGDWANTTALESTMYEITGSGFVIYPNVMRYYPRSIRCTYVGGYALDGTDAELVLVPEHVAAACAIQAAFTFRRVINETSGSKQKQDKKGFVTFDLNAAGLIGDALALLKSETRILVGGYG
jgi:hypothetical protein